MNPIFMQLLRKAKMRADELKTKRKKTATSYETEPIFPFSVSTVIKLIVLFIVIYIIDSYGWFVW